MFPSALLSVLVYASLGLAAIGLTILLVLLWRDRGSDDLW